jgi:agmatinase
MDWRDEVNGEKEGYSSPIKRASELNSVSAIYQIGLRGVGSGRQQEYDDANAYGSNLISAYEVHDIGIQAILEKIPDDVNFYITVDADGMDPTIMPAVNAPTPGGLNWLQIRELVHGIVKKGRVIGFDLVEISPSFEKGNTTLVHAERLICNFIGAMVRAGYYDSK